MSRIGLIFLGLLMSLQIAGQNGSNRYMVFFKDKAAPNYPFSIDEPESFLTQKALDRRSKQGLSVNETDLPVCPEYVETVRGIGVDLYFTSRWMNAALVQAEPSILMGIESLSFVDSIALVAEGSRLSRDKETTETPEEFKEPGSVNGTSEIQLLIHQADIMHNDGFHGEGMLIAVLDNGFRGVNETQPFEHIWKNNRLLATRDFVENSGNVFQFGEHGTSVFSTIAARYGEDYYGTAYEADFILCITEEGGSEDRIEEFNWLLGAEFADSLGADIINASLGYRLFDIEEHGYDYEDLDGKTTIVSRAAQMAADKGILVVVSAGNQGDNPPSKWRYLTPPADVKDVLTVGSVNPDLSWTNFSSLGPTVDGRIKPDVAAMGLGTAIVRGNGNITRGNGTSYSSPVMAGFAAGIWQANPDWTNIQVMDALRNGAHQSHKPDTLLGYGVPFYSYAVAGKVLNVSDILSEKITVYPNPFDGNRLFLKVEDTLLGPLTVDLVNSEGKTILNKTIQLIETSDVHEFEISDLQEGLYFLSLQYNNEKKIVKIVNF